jgi:hypothetical protein
VVLTGDQVLLVVQQLAVVADLHPPQLPVVPRVQRVRHRLLHLLHDVLVAVLARLAPVLVDILETEELGGWGVTFWQIKVYLLLLAVL